MKSVASSTVAAKAAASFGVAYAMMTAVAQNVSAIPARPKTCIGGTPRDLSHTVKEALLGGAAAAQLTMNER
jgi:hypothetical protein